VKTRNPDKRKKPQPVGQDEKSGFATKEKIKKQLGTGGAKQKEENNSMEKKANNNVGEGCGGVRVKTYGQREEKNNLDGGIPGRK